MKLKVYTDGGFREGCAAFAYAAVDSQGHIEFSSVARMASNQRNTSQRAELAAAILALAELPAEGYYEFFSDSQYLVMGVNEWMAKWKKNGWRTSQRRRVENQDLWDRINELLLPKQRTITWCWIPRDTHPMNVHVDQMVQEVLLAKA